jgi:hypothetical protein
MTFHALQLLMWGHRHTHILRFFKFIEEIFITWSLRGINLECWGRALKPLRSLIIVHGVPRIVELKAKINEIICLFEIGE